MNQPVGVPSGWEAVAARFLGSYSSDEWGVLFDVTGGLGRITGNAYALVLPAEYWTLSPEDVA